MSTPSIASPSNNSLEMFSAPIIARDELQEEGVSRLRNLHLSEEMLAPSKKTITDLSQRKIILAKEILSDSTKLKQMELSRKLKLIGLAIGMVLIIVASAAIIGGVIGFVSLLVSMLGYLALEIFKIGMTALTLIAFIKINDLITKFHKKRSGALNRVYAQQVDQFRRDLRLKSFEWADGGLVGLEKTLEDIRKKLPLLQRLSNSDLIDTLARDRIETQIAKYSLDDYKIFLSREMAAEELLKRHFVRMASHTSPSFLMNEQKDFLANLPQKIQAYDLLQFKKAAKTHLVEDYSIPRDIAELALSYV